MGKKFVIGAGALLAVLFFFLYEKEENGRNGYTLLIQEDEKGKESGIQIEDFGVVGDGKTDVTEKFQAAMEEAAKQNKMLIVPEGIYLVSPGIYRDGASTDWWCLAVPDGAKIYFETGAVIKLVDDAPEWTRILVISDVSNVNIFGHVEVDGRAQTVSKGNEHMAGIFIYDAKDVYLQSAYVHDTFGDNLFIGGTEEDFSENVTIGFFHGMTAGRKNLVIHYVDNLHVGTAILDNSLGGADNNWRGSNSLDLEPDDYRGTRNFYQKIDYLSTYGTGNDFTVGTKREYASKWVLEIGSFHAKLMAGAEHGLFSYASTVKIGQLLVQSTPENNDTGIYLSYGASWEIGDAYFIDGAGYAISAKAEGGEKPVLHLGKVLINRPEGKGIELRGADAEIEYLEGNTVKDEVLQVFATMDQSISIGQFVARNSGEDRIVHIADGGHDPSVEINRFFVADDREKKARTIIEAETERARKGLKIGSFDDGGLLDPIFFREGE